MAELLPRTSLRRLLKADNKAYTISELSQCHDHCCECRTLLYSWHVNLPSALDLGGLKSYDEKKVLASNDDEAYDVRDELRVVKESYQWYE